MLTQFQFPKNSGLWTAQPTPYHEALSCRMLRVPIRREEETTDPSTDKMAHLQC